MEQEFGRAGRAVAERELQISDETQHEAQIDEVAVVQEMLLQWRNGGHGYVPEEKPDDVVRLTAENANSLSIYHPENWKIKKCCNINNRYGSDGTLLAEGGTNWAQAPEGKRPTELFRGGGRVRCSAA